MAGDGHRLRHRRRSITAALCPLGRSVRVTTRWSGDRNVGLVQFPHGASSELSGRRRRPAPCIEPGRRVAKT